LIARQDLQTTRHSSERTDERIEIAKHPQVTSEQESRKVSRHQLACRRPDQREWLQWSTASAARRRLLVAFAIWKFGRRLPVGVALLLSI